MKGSFRGEKHLEYGGDESKKLDHHVTNIIDGCGQQPMQNETTEWQHAGLWLRDHQAS